MAGFFYDVTLHVDYHQFLFDPGKFQLRLDQEGPVFPETAEFVGLGRPHPSSLGLFGRERRLVASPEKPLLISSRVVSFRISCVYRPYGIRSMLTPPFRHVDNQNFGVYFFQHTSLGRI